MIFNVVRHTYILVTVLQIIENAIINSCDSGNDVLNPIQNEIAALGDFYVYFDCTPLGTKLFQINNSNIQVQPKRADYIRSRRSFKDFLYLSTTTFVSETLELSL